MSDSLLQDCIATVPPGAWAVGVSGGADSVALLSLLRCRSDLQLHVVHLNHQARGEASDADAQFVEQLCRQLNVPCTSMLRGQIEPTLKDLPSNLSARFRALRLSIYERIVSENKLLGVILAHHADDQAETILHRLIRGSGVVGLTGMCSRTVLGNLLVLRPLLAARHQMLREHLIAEKISWREDESNQSEKYLRNRLRVELKGYPELFDPLLELGQACQSLRDWARATAPILADEFFVSQVSDLPRILQEESARAWLLRQGVPAAQIQPETIDRLLQMSLDAATGARQDFPGNVHIRRKQGKIRAAEPPAADLVP